MGKPPAVSACTPEAYERLHAHYKSGCLPHSVHGVQICIWQFAEVPRSVRDTTAECQRLYGKEDIAMTIRQNFLAGLAAVTLVAGSAAAQSDQSANRMNANDTFMTRAAQGGMAEVELGRLAVKNASNDEVKQFGQRMIDDHTKANDQLKSIAAKKNVTLPAHIDAKQRSEMNRLSKLNGAAFDREYMMMMVRDHKQDVSEFEKASKNESDPDVKSFASSTLPTLQEHLKLAEQTESQIKK